MNVGLNTTCTLPLRGGSTYYFAATAYDVHQNESPLSAELSVTLPPDTQDTDADGITDFDEENLYGTDPQNADSDADGLEDGAELDFWGEAWSLDVDGDGLAGLLDPDSDNDGALDGWEIAYGYDPADPYDCQLLTVEDAEDGLIEGWTIFDATPAGAGIANLFDAVRQSRVVVLSGTLLDNCFRLARPDSGPWHYPGPAVLQWSMKSAQPFAIYVELLTSAGLRYLYYRPDDQDLLGTGTYIHQALGSTAASNQWVALRRDLQADLVEAQPGVSLLEVNSILVRGSLSLDDIRLGTAVR